MNKRNSIVILMADDDEDDRLIAQEAVEESHIASVLHTVENGEQLLDYLNRRGDYQSLAGIPLPGLILLDLNMPIKDGREALRDIKEDPNLRRIPVVVLTTSNSKEDIYHTYDMGANSYIKKPETFESLVDLIKALGTYWFDIVELPPDGLS